MQLFLTSAGVTTPELGQYFIDLIHTGNYIPHIAYITTAANPEVDKSFQTPTIEKLKALKGITLETIDITTEGAEKVLEHAGVIWVGGGNTFFLLDSIRKFGYKEKFETLCKTRLYAGSSAGSIVATPHIKVAFVDPPDNNFLNLTDFTGMNFVPFEFAPHVPEISTIDDTKKYATKSTLPVYSCSDEGAIFYNTDKGQVISVGTGVELLNPSLNS